MLVDQRKEEKKQKFKETGDLRYIYQNKVDKALFQHGNSYEDFKDLTRRKTSDKILHNKAFKICQNSRIWWVSKGSCFSGL